MSLSQSVLICDQVNPVLNEILEKNGLQITYEPEITPEQIAEKIGNFEKKLKKYLQWPKKNYI